MIQRRIVLHLQRALTAPQPTDALRALAALRADLDAYERAQVMRALADGESFAEVARALGITRQAAHRRYRRIMQTPPGGPPRPPTRSHPATVRRAL